jgi:uncharacterized protein YlzI (FlbEa/FlbD family)
MFIKLTRMSGERPYGQGPIKWNETGEIVYVRHDRIDMMVWNQETRNTTITMACGECEIVKESPDDIIRACTSLDGLTK